MMRAIFYFEFKNWLKHPLFYSYLIFFFMMNMLAMAGSAGAFGDGSANNALIANSPLNIYKQLQLSLNLLILLIPAITGHAAIRDYKANFAPLFFTYPFTSRQYIVGKFFSALSVVGLISLSILGGIVAGTLIPQANESQLMGFQYNSYLSPFIVFTIPTIIFFTVITFGVSIVTRNAYAGYAAVIVVLLLNNVLGALTAGNQNLYFILDPFGSKAIDFQIRFWTLLQQNTQDLLISDLILVNRAAWILLTVSIFISIFQSFSFDISRKSLFFGRFSRKVQLAPPNPFNSSHVNVNLNFSANSYVRMTFTLLKANLRFVLKSGIFIVVCIVGVLFIWTIVQFPVSATQTKMLPLTGKILGLPVFIFSMAILGLTFLYSGILINRAKDCRIYDLLAVTPAPNRIFLFSIFSTVAMMQLFLLFLVFLTGIVIQIWNGIVPFEVAHYAFDLIFIHFLSLIIWAMASVLVHTLFRNTYLGFFVLLLSALAINLLEYFGIESSVVLFSDSPEPEFYLSYSDMNGHSRSLISFLLYKSYWLLVGATMLSIALLFWNRELVNSFRENMKLCIHSFKGRLATVILVFATLSVSFAFGLLLVEKHPDNFVMSPKQEVSELERFKSTFGKYINVTQPRITDVFVSLDIFPELNKFEASGTYTLVNKSIKPIDTLLVRTGFDEITVLEYSIPASLIESDSILNFSVLKLAEPILAGDSMVLKFSVRNKPNTLLVTYSNVLKNGTYLSNDIFPSLGYFASEQKVHPKSVVPGGNHYQRIDSDLVRFEAIISTSEDQLAITSGRLIKQWKNNMRNHFHYLMDFPIKNVVGFNSARYSVSKVSYRGVDLAIYHDAGHFYNIEQMLEGLKSGIDYNSTYFSPYQHKQAQVVEFPLNFGTHATTSGNCIQMSELRFVNDTTNLVKEGIDIAFYVAAHELSHQWWGNQVIPADALGATMVTESISEYIAVKVLEKKYGKRMAIDFLKIQKDRYLLGRVDDSKAETPLYLVADDQTYISYGKGAIALYTLSEIVGEEILNACLKEFLNSALSTKGRYVTSLDLIRFLEDGISADHRYLVKEFFISDNSETLLKHFEDLLKAN